MRFLVVDSKEAVQKVDGARLVKVVGELNSENKVIRIYAPYSPKSTLQTIFRNEPLIQMNKFIRNSSI